MKTLILVLGLCIAGSPVLKAQTAEPPGGLDELSAYSIYYENYKNEDYESVLRYGRWIHKAMPRELKGYPQFDLERNLQRLITAYSEVAQSKQDPSLRSAYLDSAQIIFDKVFEEFSSDEIDTFDWYFQQGRFLQENSDYLSDGLARAYEIYLKLFEMDAEKFTRLGDGYYIQITLQNLVSKGEKDQALQIIETAEPFANQKVLEYFDKIRNQLFDSPKERITFLEGKMEENPDSTALLNELAKLYEEQNMVAEARKMREKLYQVDPTYENTLALADLAINNASYDLAIKYLKEALDKTDDESEKSRLALKLSDAYLNKDDLPQARSFARQAADLDPEWGQPYLQMASIYGSAVNQCTSGRKMERRDKVVYWLVLDYLDRARQVDSSLSNQVQRQYQSYQPVTPTTEEKFFWSPSLETGQEIDVDSNLMPCYDWIDETTTVR